MADETKTKVTDEAKQAQAAADEATKAALERKAQKKVWRKELRDLQAKGVVQVYPGTSHRLVSKLNRDERKHLQKSGRTVPDGLTPEESKRAWELHYLIAGKPIPVNENLDD